MSESSLSGLNWEAPGVRCQLAKSCGGRVIRVCLFDVGTSWLLLKRSQKETVGFGSSTPPPYVKMRCVCVCAVFSGVHLRLKANQHKNLGFRDPTIVTHKGCSGLYRMTSLKGRTRFLSTRMDMFPPVKGVQGFTQQFRSQKDVPHSKDFSR